MVDAVVLAGRANRGKLAAISSEPNEAMIPIAGESMLGYVIRALLAADRVGRVAVVGPRDLLAPGLGGLADRVLFVEPRGDIVDNLLAGVDALGSRGMTLIVTSDVPLLTPRVVTGFLQECSIRKADLHYPIVSRELAESRFPGMRRTYARLRDGAFTGGNMVLVNPDVLRDRAADARNLFAARKQPLRLAAILGPYFLIRLLLRRLTVPELERAACRIFGLAGTHAVRTAFAEIGVDVDKPADHELVTEFLSAGRGG